MDNPGETSFDQLATLAVNAGSAAIAGQARDLADRVAEGRFYLGFVGQFKRGKSTLIDALLGEAILPIGVVPITAVPTIVRYDDERSARVRLAGSAWRAIPLESVEEYVSESENPGNIRNVEAIEIFLPNHRLAGGMCLVDTPGIGSVFEANTRATLEFVPRIDAAVIVLGADPPVSAIEASLIERICEHVDVLIFAMNKADRVTADEMSAASRFADRILTARLKRQIEMFRVSARAQLEEETGAWEWNAFVAALERIASGSERAVARRSQQRAGSVLAQKLLGLIRNRREALLTPIEELERQVEALGSHIADLQHSILDLGHLLGAEQERSVRALEGRRNEFLESGAASAHQLLDERLQSSVEHGAAFRRRAMTAALEVAKERVTPWLRKEERLVTDEYGHTIGRFNSTVDAYLQKLAATGVGQLGSVADAPVESGTLTTPSRFQFHDLLHVARPASPFRHLGDLFLAAARRREPIRRDAHDFLTHLMETNTSRVEADLIHRLGVARRELEITVKQRLNSVMEIAGDVLHRTRETRRGGNPAIQAELKILEGLEAEAAALAGKIAAGTES